MVDESNTDTAKSVENNAHDSEILESQERLGKALDKARAGDDRALATAVREDGELFVRIFYGLLRMIRLHDLDNQAFGKPILEFVSVTERLCELLGAVNIVCVEEQVYINDIRIRFDECIFRPLPVFDRDSPLPSFRVAVDMDVLLGRRD